MFDVNTALLAVGVALLAVWVGRQRHSTAKKNYKPAAQSSNVQDFNKLYDIKSSPGDMIDKQEFDGQILDGQSINEQFAYREKTLGGLLGEIASIDSSDIMVTNNVEQRTTKNLQAEDNAYQRAPRTEPPRRPQVDQYSDCDSRRIVATFRPGLEQSPSVYTRGSKDFAYAVPQVELDQLSDNPTVSGQYQWDEDRFTPYIGQISGMSMERSDASVASAPENIGPDSVRRYVSSESIRPAKLKPTNYNPHRSGFLGEPGFQVDAVNSQILPSVARKGERDFSLEFFNNYMDIRDMHKNMGATGDNLLFNRMKYVAIQPQVAKDIRARWNTNSLKPFVEEELRAQAEKIWWENDDLDVYM